MMQPLVSLGIGLLFGTGLLLSGMTQPPKVIGFLDVLGNWDPSLAFVMGGALIVNAPLYWLTNRRERPFLASTYSRPATTSLTGSLWIGAALFGLGWGLAGYCPGPALTSFGALEPSAWVFCGAMFAGFAIARRLQGTTQGSATK